MPLKKCTKDGKSGWKYGDSGHCYTGPGAKKKAIKQGVAIEGPQKFAEKAAEFEVDESDFNGIMEVVNEVLKEDARLDKFDRMAAIMTIDITMARGIRARNNASEDSTDS